MPYKNLTDFGPCGNGVLAEDDSAFTLAIAYMQQSRRAVTTPAGGTAYRNTGIFVPPGDYTVTGNLGANLELLNIRAEPNTVTIRIASGNYLFAIPNRLDMTCVRGITFIGGKGMLNHSHPGNNVSQQHIIEDCVFYEYTECAILSEAADMPYWTVRRCHFYAAPNYAQFYDGGNILDSVATPMFAGKTVSVTVGDAEPVHASIANGTTTTQVVASDGTITLTGGPRAVIVRYARPETCKGLVIGGLNDSSLIEQNAFCKNDVHLQLGPTNSGCVTIRGNDFISHEPDRTDCDIWFIPNDEQMYGANAGPCLSVENNKFGNEGIVVGGSKKAPRLLVAAKNGALRGTAVPDPNWKNSSDGRHALQGLQFRGNLFSNGWIDASLRGVDAPLMRIHIEQLGQLKWEGSNQISGGSYSYLFEHVSGGQRLAQIANMDWTVDLGGHSGAPFRRGVSSDPIGPIHDPFGISGSRHAILPVPASSQAVSLVSVGTPNAWPAIGSVSKQAAINSDGNLTATQAVFAAGGYFAVPITFSDRDTLAWLRGRVKRPAANALDRLAFIVDCWNGSASAGLTNSIVSLREVDQWIDICIPFIIPANAVNGAVLSGPAWAGLTGEVTYGDFKVVTGPVAPAL